MFLFSALSDFFFSFAYCAFVQAQGYPHLQSFSSPLGNYGGFAL